MTVTIRNLDTKTPDEVFRFVAEHLLSQKCRAVINQQCKYRVHTNLGILRCAAGCLIPDELYLPEMEGRSWKTLTRNISSRTGLPTEHSQLISDLQQVHDISTPEEWVYVLRKVAQVHNLSQSTQDWIKSRSPIEPVKYEVTN